MKTKRILNIILRIDYTATEDTSSPLKTCDLGKSKRSMEVFLKLKY